MPQVHLPLRCLWDRDPDLASPLNTIRTLTSDTCHRRPRRPIQPQQDPCQVISMDIRTIHRRRFTTIQGLPGEIAWGPPHPNHPLITTPWIGKWALAYGAIKPIRIPSHHYFAGNFSNIINLPVDPPPLRRKEARHRSKIDALKKLSHQNMLSVIFITPTTIWVYLWVGFPHLKTIWRHIF